MNTIYKYPLELQHMRQEITMPQGARILTVRLQLGSPQLWALVRPGNGPEQRAIYVYGTGNPLPPGVEFQTYIGTFQQGAYVWHVFEGKI